MSYGLLSLGVQGVRASQSGLAVVGNNITNVNTPGYNRQVAQFNSLEGGGVLQDSTQRIVDQYITQRLWADNSRFEAAKAFEAMASQLDNTLASDSVSLSAKLDDYFAALQAANDDPTSITNRELFIAEAQATATRFNDLYDQVSQQTETVNTRIRELAEEINSAALNIADLNDRIRIAKAANKDAFELLDQRDQAVQELSQLVDINVIEQGDEFSIFIGNGQPLVVGQSFNPMVSTPNELDPTRQEIGIRLAGRVNDLTGMVGGGELGGLLAYRDDVLDPTLNELGRLAVVFADSMNQQHQLGMDLDGNMGQNLFADINSANLLSTRVQAEFADGSVQIVDSSKLHASDYDLVFTSSDSFRLTRLSDGKSWTDSSFSVAATNTDVDMDGEAFFDSTTGELTLQIDGFRLDLSRSGGFATNERVLVQPVRTAADDIAVNIRDGRQLALATPVVVAPDSSNNGTGAATVQLTELSNPKSTDPRDSIAALMPNSGSQLTVTADSTVVPEGYTVVSSDGLALSISLDPDDSKNLIIRNADPSLNGEIVMRVEGVPQDGDSFVIDFNFDVDGSDIITNVGVSDNRNGLLMSDLTKAATSLEGSYQETYGRIIERVGIDTKIAQTDLRASEAVLKNTTAQREEISGVNLDEEAVKLIQFQQAYQAAAQIISASQRIFDSLIQAV
ncbi:flagellar hook-associated protein FlgK [Marinobacterium sp. D7]|uniref:flagellar hook-associated protein FlgK n=1 Tax=Marinobacterium ramblicola TaxID=2849041 RepID=UPI001C2D280B|nr:flagellar hook-associated protein FlgK [Marinobacterium ramblicola]MBV1788862.1 flagellar hook-associated protein FlgK [Marinobacterium ramblicola]